MIYTPTTLLRQTITIMGPSQEYTKKIHGRREMALRRLIPQQLLTCLTALNCFKAARLEFSRPNADISLGGVKVRALFDTGSGVTLCNNNIRPMVGLPCSTLGLPELRTANGSSLRVDRCVMVLIKLPNSTRDIHHKVLFVGGLQVPCILGMDFMKKARIIINNQAGKIKMEPPLPGAFKHNPARLLTVKREVSIKPREEMQVIGECDVNFATASATSNNNEMVHVMDGLVDGKNSNKCPLILLKPSLDTVNVPRGTIVGSITPVDASDFAPIEQVLQINLGTARPQISDVAHFVNIKLNHLPLQYKERYVKLIRSYSDIFSRHNLDVGHSTTLPHTVRLLDPNKVVSVNQYQLPYHLKEVAIDYVDKLLKSGVIRPSTSVFKSPLMLVKKPNADPNKEKYVKLIRSYSDIFSKHDLDVGHSSTLPHTVRLLDPNKIVSVNQYRLPYHLKEVAIDYVDKLLKSGVIRPSTSVFNSPLMLVKKPNADPSKPLGEQYRLVHNYIELNKLIVPCSYPLRHMYELLDEVVLGKVFSVLDLSQGFFQQTLIDQKETTSLFIHHLQLHRNTTHVTSRPFIDAP